MRKGYRREYDPDKDSELLLDPNGETIGSTAFGKSHGYAFVTSYLIQHKTKRVNDRDELRRLLAHLTDKHYMDTTTGLRRFKDNVWRVSRAPVWGWFAFLIAAAAFVANLFGWMG